MGRRSVRGAGVAAVALAAVAGSGGSAAASTPNVLLVGTYNGVHGTYATIQAAVNAAHTGDWVLVGPGDYHEQADYANSARPAGVAISTPQLHLRGMNRNTVVVDGTKPGPRPVRGSRPTRTRAPTARGATASRSSARRARPTASRSRTSRPATSSPATAAATATRSGGTAAMAAARSTWTDTPATT